MPRYKVQGSIEVIVEAEDEDEAEYLAEGKMDLEFLYIETLEIDEDGKEVK
jgi:hypothetical protein